MTARTIKWIPDPPRSDPAPAAAIGMPGAAGTPTIYRTAGEALGGHRAVKIASDGTAYYVSPGDPDVDAVAGITTGAAAEGASATIMPNGEMTESGWSWTPGPVWLADNGTLTQTVPTSGAVVRMGTALGTTTMFVEPRLIAKL